MVLGLGSRSKKDRLSSSSSHPPDLNLRLLEIRPWHGLQAPKASSSVILRCFRGDKLLGTTRSVSPKVGTAVDGGKIVFNETFRIPAAVSRDAYKKLRKSSGDSERLLVFHLLETNNVKGQPLGHASLNLAAYASIDESKTIGIQLTLSRKVSSKGTSSYLHVTVQRHQDEGNADSGPVVAEQHFNPPVSSVTSASSKTSEASSPPPLDDATHQRLVEALLSDEDDEIASFTDDEISRGSGASQDNVTGADASDSRLSETTQTATISQAREVTEKRIETAEVRISQPAISSPQASPVKAAAAAAAAAYATKRSLLSRDTSSFVAVSYDLSSEPASPGDDGCLTPDSDGARSPNLLSKNYFASNHSSSFKSSTAGGSEAVSNNAAATMVKAHEEMLKVVIDEKKQTLEAYTGSRELSGEGNSVGGGAVVGNPAKVDEKPELGCISSKTSGIKVAPAAGSSKERVGNIASNAVKCAGEDEGVSERTSPVSEKEGSQNSGNTVKADLKTAGSNNGKVFEPSFERKPSLPNNLKKESVFDKSNRPNGDSELAKVQAGSRLEEGQIIEDKYQRKSLIETKSRVSVRASPKEDAVQEAKMTFSRSTVGNNEKLDKKSTEAAKTVVALAEAKVAAAEAKVQHLEKQIDQLQGELRDVAAVEAALYTNTTEHGSSSLKVHSPARRLTRLYIYACKHWSQERRASCARNTVGGLVLVSRACGHDVARLTFWWSNTVVLRETISMAFDVSRSSPRLETALGSLKSRATGRDLHIAGEKYHEGFFQESHISSPAAKSEDWRETSTFTAALERVEAWIYAKVVESIWWQVLTPRMQQSGDASLLNELDGASENVSLYGRRNGKRALTLELMDGKQGNTSIEIWKKAFFDAYERLCPVRAMGVECGCLPILIKMVLEECIVRLDVAMFNAILRGDDDEAPTDPVSDPISDARVLPIPISTLSFGIGAQLKSVVGILSAWLIDLLSKNSESIMTSQIQEDDEKTWVMFPLLKATGDLLMLPKESLQNRALRKEACPFLSLSFIGRILSNFKPDEFSPEPVTPELLEAINLEIFAENERRGELDYNVITLRIATAPPVVYSPPQSSMVRTMIGDPKSYPGLSRSSSSLLRKGHTSDDEIDELESPISWLWENTTGLMSEGHGGLIAGYKDSSYANEKMKDTSKGAGKICRFELLRDVWNTDLLKYL